MTADAIKRYTLRHGDLVESDVGGLVFVSDCQRLEAQVAALREALIACVPRSWLDPLLTGPESVLPSSGKYDGRHIEALLNGIRQRMGTLLTTAGDKP